MITLCKIDDRDFDVLITGIERNFNVIEGENSGVSLYKQRELRDIKGIKIGHTITFDGSENPDEYNELIEYLFGSIRNSVVIDIIHGRTRIRYEAAYNTAADKVSHTDENAAYWNELSVDFRPIENQIDNG